MFTITQILIVGPGLPVTASGCDGVLESIMVSMDLANTIRSSDAPTCTTCGNCRGKGRVRELIKHDPLFESVSAEELKWLRVFHEVVIEFMNGASSLRQAGLRIDTRKTHGRYPLELPTREVGACRSHQYVTEFFRKRLGLDDDLQIFASAGKGKARFALTDIGWDLWERTNRYLIKRGFISETR